MYFISFKKENGYLIKIISIPVKSFINYRWQMNYFVKVVFLRSGLDKKKLRGICYFSKIKTTSVVYI